MRVNTGRRGTRDMNRGFAYLVTAVFLLNMIGCRAAIFEGQHPRLHSEEQQLVGVWRLLRSVDSDDNQERTKLMLLNPDRTWLHASCPGKGEIPGEFSNIIHGPHWACFRNDLRQYLSPTEDARTIFHRRKVLSVTPTILRLEVWKKPWLQPYVYIRVTGQTEADIKRVFAKIDKGTP